MYETPHVVSHAHCFAEKFCSQASLDFALPLDILDVFGHKLLLFEAFIDIEETLEFYRVKFQSHIDI